MTTQTTTINSVSNSVASWFLRQQMGLRRRQQYQTFQQAVDRAYARFARQHPIWAASLFDAHFLRHQAAPQLQRYLQSETRPTARELAEAWYAQFPAVRLEAHDLNEVTHAAGAFLRLLEEELS